MDIDYGGWIVSSPALVVCKVHSAQYDSKLFKEIFQL